MEMLLLLVVPVVVVMALVVAMISRVVRRHRWDPTGSHVDLKGRTAIVTGANTGIGFHVAVELARRGARVILACRSRERGEVAARAVAKAARSPRVAFRRLDLSSLASVREFARETRAREERLDILVNNAGVSGLPTRITEDGLEVTYATNHLGPFLLTNLLLDTLRQSAPSRVVTVSSGQHHRGVLHLPNLVGRELAQTTGTHQCYNNTKLMNVLFTRQLARTLSGTGVSASVVHPGVVNTEVIRHAAWIIRVIFKTLAPLCLKTAREGACPVIFCCLSEEMARAAGDYVDSDCRMAEPSVAARDDREAAKLWKESMRLTGLMEHGGEVEEDQVEEEEVKKFGMNGGERGGRGGRGGVEINSNVSLRK